MGQLDHWNPGYVFLKSQLLNMNNFIQEIRDNKHYVNVLIVEPEMEIGYPVDVWRPIHVEVTENGLVGLPQDYQVF